MGACQEFKVILGHIVSLILKPAGATQDLYKQTNKKIKVSFLKCGVVLGRLLSRQSALPHNHELLCSGLHHHVNTGHSGEHLQGQRWEEDTGGSWDSLGSQPS